MGRSAQTTAGLCEADWWTRPLAALRANRWPDRSRVRAVALYMLIAYIPMMAHVFAQATGRVGSDFLAFWGAGRLVLAGTPWDAFNLAAEAAAQAPSHTGQMVAYVNPPPYLFLTAPLGLMPFGTAWLAWAICGWLVWFAASHPLMPRHPLAVMAFPAAYLAACHAQNGFVTGALLVAGVSLLARRDAAGQPDRPDRRDCPDRRECNTEMAAGMLFGALVIKPHLALLVPLWLLAGGRWRALAGAGVSAMALCLASLIAFGPATWAAYPQSFQVSTMLMTHAPVEFFLRMATPYALIRVLLGASAATVGQAVITLGCGWLVWHATRRHGANAGTGALMLAATTIASPYLFSYDLPFLIQPVAWLAGSAALSGWRPWEKATVIALYMAPLATRAAALPLHANLMPLAGLALVWVIASRLRRFGPDGAGTEQPALA